MGSVIVKLNEGVSGEGNALVRLSGLPAPGASDERAAVMERLRGMELESQKTPARRLPAKFEEGAGIVEERITGEEVRSPSVQLRVLPGGAVELLSTHDQLLGGASGQSYLGCTFPADPEYAEPSPGTPRRSGGGWPPRRPGTLRGGLRRGARATAQWTPYAIELNLRKGGTTHPFLTLQFLTDGRYDPDTALFLTPRGHEKHLVATDHLESGLLRGLALPDLFDIVARHGLHFDQSRQVGIVFHMISCLTEHGRIGLTAVGDTPTEADRRYRDAEADPAGGGAGGTSGEPAARSEDGRATDLVRRLRLEPGDRLGSAATSPEGARRVARAVTPVAGTRVNPPGPRAWTARRPRVRRGARVWGGGMAFYDARHGAAVAGRAYLVTTEQFADVAAQEMRRPPGGEFARDLARLLARRRYGAHTGPGATRRWSGSAISTEPRCSLSPTTTSGA